MKKFFSVIATIAAVAVMGFSCNPPEPTPDPTPEKLTASVSPSEITADGQSKAVFTVKYGDKAVSNVKAYVNGAETTLNGLTFTTTTAGSYKFYFSYEWTTGKIVKSNEVTVTAKAVEQSGDTSGLTMTVDKAIIKAGEGRATFTIMYNGAVVEKDYTIYDGNNNKLSLPTTSVTINGKSYKQPYFESATTGEYSFWASYKTENTKNMAAKVTVVNEAIPDRAEDPNPSSTSFKRRTMIMQFTGTECPNCPRFIAALEQLEADATYKDLFTWAAIHTFNPSTDPAAPSDDVTKGLGTSFGISSYPMGMFDMSQRFNSVGTAADVVNMKNYINNAQAADAPVGISATMTLDANNRNVTVRASVKAKDSKEYRIGIWVLENNIKGGQAGSSTITSHDHAVRYADSKNNSSFTGYDLGMVKAGEVVDRVFNIKIKNQSIVLNNCYLLIFVTANNGTVWTVVNSAVTKDLKTALPFEYK